MSDLLLDALGIFDWFVLGYFAVLNTIMLVVLLVAAPVVLRSVSRPERPNLDDLFVNPMTPAISVVIPAYNEEQSIVASTRAALALRYPRTEVVVVDDGSTDATFELLRERFDLVEVAPDIGDEIPTAGAVRSLHVAADPGVPLVVIRKVNTRRRADALNVGINTARHELVCCIDADSVLEPDALLHAARPFVDDPDRVVAVGGAIRAVNGSIVDDGHIRELRTPRRWVERIQIIEYLRSFLLARTGWSRLGGVIIVSGAFGVYRRDVLVGVGGFDIESLGEDADVIVAIHRRQRALRHDYRVVSLAEPVCWTEVPSTARVLARQRRRWSHGLAQVLWKQRAMVGNPRYGRIGVLALPYYLVFELLGPVVEIVGLVAVLLGLWLGVISPSFAALVVVAAFVYGVLVSAGALLLEEMSFQRYRRWRDLGALLAAAVMENIGFRQMHAWWRLWGLVQAVRGTESAWGEMERLGLASGGSVPEHTP